MEADDGLAPFNPGIKSQLRTLTVITPIRHTLGITAAPTVMHSALPELTEPGACGCGSSGRHASRRGSGARDGNGDFIGFRVDVVRSELRPKRGRGNMNEGLHRRGSGAGTELNL